MGQIHPSLVLLFTFTFFLLAGNVAKVFSQKHKNEIEAQECLGNLEGIINSLDKNVNPAELSNERVQDIKEIKEKYDVFRLHCHNIITIKTLKKIQYENCMRKCKDLISDIHMDVNKIFMELDGWSTGG